MSGSTGTRSRSAARSSNEPADGEAAESEVITYVMDDDPDDPDGVGRVHYGSRMSPQVVDGLANGTVTLVSVDAEGKATPLKGDTDRARAEVEHAGADPDAGASAR